jgi:hypothetical protein
LGIQRHTAIDRLISEQLIDYLSEHGESILRSATLGDGERRCRHPQCSEALALDHHATWVLSGDVSSTGPNNTLRVQARLFDVRRRGTEGAVADMENLCTDCDETKLGILITTTTSDLINHYRQTAPALPPVASTPPSAPSAPPPPPDDDPAAALANSPLTVSSLPADSMAGRPVTQAPPPPAAWPEPQQLPAQGQQPLPPQQPLPQGQQPLPPLQQPPPQAYPPPVYYPVPAPLPPVSSNPPHRSLSRTRKIVATLFGVAGFGALAAAGVMNGLDRKLAPDYVYDPNGRACSAPQNAGKNCVLSTVGFYAPTYAVGGLLVVGMILTLALPESRPRPPPPPDDGTP